jgi:F0F1-type ATP synthase assembly protein I
MPDERDNGGRFPSDDAEERFRKIREELEAMKLPDEDELPRLENDKPLPTLPHVDEFDARLSALEENARNTKSRIEATKQQEQRALDADRSSARGLGFGLSIAYTIIGFPMLGAGVGWLIDRQNGTNNWMGLMTVLGAGLGVFAAILMLNRTNRIK